MRSFTIMPRRCLRRRKARDTLACLSSPTSAQLTHAHTGIQMHRQAGRQMHTQQAGRQAAAVDNGRTTATAAATKFRQVFSVCLGWMLAQVNTCVSRPRKYSKVHHDISTRPRKQLHRFDDWSSTPWALHGVLLLSGKFLTKPFGGRHDATAVPNPRDGFNSIQRSPIKVTLLRGSG